MPELRTGLRQVLRQRQAPAFSLLLSLDENRGCARGSRGSHRRQQVLIARDGGASRCGCEGICLAPRRQEVCLARGRQRAREQARTAPRLRKVKFNEEKSLIFVIVLSETYMNSYARRALEEFAAKAMPPKAAAIIGPCCCRKPLPHGLGRYICR